MPEFVERENLIANAREYNLGGSYDNTEQAVPVSLIRSMPAADVRPAFSAKPVQFYNDPWTGRRFTTCSACDGKISKRDKFCKHCGAEMKGGEQNGRL